jgi:AbrB family looped-hinge helix DNA binding protein
MQTTLTSKGQVTIPRDVRQLFGLRQGMAIRFTVEGDHIALRPAPSAREAPISGFGLIKSHRSDVPVDLDPASLAVEAP